MMLWLKLLIIQEYELPLIVAPVISMFVSSCCGDTDTWQLAFNDNSDFDAVVQLWKKIIKIILPISCAHLDPVLKDGLKSKELSENAAVTVVGLFAAVQDTLQPQLKQFVKSVSI